MQRHALLPLLAALVPAANASNAAEIAPGLTLDGSMTIELRSTHLETSTGVQFAPHLRWTNPEGRFGFDLGAEIWRDGEGLTMTDLTYGSVFLHLGDSTFHVGKPKTAIEEILRFPAFTTSTPENEFARTYGRSRVRLADFEMDGQLPGMSWSHRFGRVEVAISAHRFSATGIEGGMPTTQLAMRYDQGGTVLMAGAEMAWASMPLTGTSHIQGYHLGALQEFGNWRFGFLLNRLEDDLGTSSSLTRLHADYDLGPNLNVGLQYERLADWLTVEGVALSARYDAPGLPLFLEAGVLHDDLSGNVFQTGLGITF